MPFLKTLFLYVIPGIGFTTYQVLKLGPKLPQASRKMGQNIGLGYQIFKAVMKVNLPTDIIKSNEIIKLIRRTEQQTNAFSREVRQKVLEIKQEIKQDLPSELQNNPFRSLQLTPITHRPEEEKTVSNQNILVSVIQEREWIVQQKNERQKDQTFSQTV